MTLNHEIARRRTFAIISHPDAGKTTLTEKLLLYGGAVQLAGSVTARKNQRASTSDWMELERKRGISVSSTVLQFDYRDYCVNLLDTPGHKDFSEDTYRVLTAVDAVVMVIDAAKGIESQTRKLFEVCRMRGIPIFTFINKLDRPARPPLDLLDELEAVLGIRSCAVNWPLGMGQEFQGVFDRLDRRVYFFERVPGGAYRAPISVFDLAASEVSQRLEAAAYSRLTDELVVLDEAGEAFEPKAVLRGELTPVFFGSAVNNFGVQLLLDAFLDHSPPPSPRLTTGGPIAPDHPAFSGFIFKIQSNMDPKHRDQIAFMRICSGQFSRDMRVVHSRTGETVRLSSSHKLFARERETVDAAYPGDVIGLVGHPEFGIGDTLTEDRSITFHEIPRFAPECFAFLHSTSASQFKRFRSGLEHLLQEGVVQTYYVQNSQQRVPLLGALQFEVLQYRLETEYGAGSRLETTPWRIIRWVSPETAAGVTDEMLPTGSRLAMDDQQQSVLLFTEEWACNFFTERNPGIHLAKQPGNRTLWNETGNPDTPVRGCAAT
jgi:peptide chain release factor 3